MKKLTISLLLLAFLLGFSSDASAGAACFAVTGEMEFEKKLGVPGVFGTISGDLEGTVVVKPFPVEYHGVARHRDVTQTWVITDSIVDDLIGKTLVLDGFLKGQLTDRPILKTTHIMRVVAGAGKGNFTFHGWTDVTGYTPEAPVFIHESEYHGVICP
ncbi:MAG: hypothetical protein ABFS03_09870 [Chloroflexota bacterium]